MIFSSFNHVNCFLVFLFFGIIIGFINLIFSILFLKKYQKKFLNCIFDVFFYTFLSIFFIFLINIFNFGEFSFALILAFLLGFIWIKKACKNLFAFLSKKWYNVFIKLKSNKKHNEKHKKI